MYTLCTVSRRTKISITDVTQAEKKTASPQSGRKYHNRLIRFGISCYTSVSLIWRHMTLGLKRQQPHICHSPDDYQTQLIFIGYVAIWTNGKDMTEKYVNSTQAKKPDTPHSVTYTSPCLFGFLFVFCWFYLCFSFSVFCLFVYFWWKRQHHNDTCHSVACLPPSVRQNTARRCPRVKANLGHSHTPSSQLTQLTPETE